MLTSSFFSEEMKNVSCWKLDKTVKRHLLHSPRNTSPQLHPFRANCKHPRTSSMVETKGKTFRVWVLHTHRLYSYMKPPCLGPKLKFNQSDTLFLD